MDSSTSVEEDDDRLVDEVSSVKPLPSVSV